MVIDAGCVELMTLGGGMVRVMAADGKVMVNQATVIQPDIIGEGGVIHGIDTVVLPGTFEPCPAPPMMTDAPMATAKGSKKASSSKGKGSKKMASSGKGGSPKMSSSKGAKKTSSGKRSKGATR